MDQKRSNSRRYLTADELEKLIKAGRKGRYGRRDATLILLMARHGLRVTEAIDLRWDQIDFSKGHLHVRRLKGGVHSVHPISSVYRTVCWIDLWLNWLGMVRVSTPSFASW